MCGIVGVHDFAGTGAQIPRSTFDGMTDALAHRGPDGRGVWHGDSISLGHRRLAILDPTPDGAQPMHSADGQAVITYNGEIYNFRELRAELERCGHRFRSGTDTEVILAAYREWGTDCVTRLNGIFAFGLWDVARRRLWLVRDRLGVKPLYYTTSGAQEGSAGVLRFASELKAILADPGFVRRPSTRGLNAFLSFGYVPAPLTGFDGISQLLPGQQAVVENGRIEISKYWSLSMRTVERSADDALEEFSARFERSVRRQLLSDVPLGAFLSGGIDSAAVAAAANDSLADALRTFSVRFQEESFDESAQAALTARRVGTQHTEIQGSLDLVANIDRLVEACEGPFADSSSLAVYSLCRETSREVKVALSGDGADELLAGYPTYSASSLAGVYRRAPRWTRQLARGSVGLLKASDRRYNARQFAERFLLGAEEGEGRDFGSWRVHLRDSDKQSLCRPGLFANDDSPIDLYAQHYWDAPEAESRLKRMLYADLSFYLPNDMLVKVDRMSMAHGLEVRVPFLDHELVEFCASLPDRLLATMPLPGKNKLILRRHLRRKLGSEVARRKKRGFNVPVEKGMRNGLVEHFHEAIGQKNFVEEGPFDTQALHEFAARHARREIDAGHALFTVLMLARWWDKWL
ncbi:MAG: asparagine synthase (glutamine-hydrolyzing) [Planctomycetaceae bacterium]